MLDRRDQIGKMKMDAFTRRWATRILHEYLQKGFAMNDDLLKNMGVGLYWKELC